MLKEHAAGIAVAKLCRKHGINDATFYTRRKCYGEGGAGRSGPSREDDAPPRGGRRRSCRSGMTGALIEPGPRATGGSALGAAR